MFGHKNVAKGLSMCCESTNCAENRERHDNDRSEGNQTERINEENKEWDSQSSKRITNKRLVKVVLDGVILSNTSVMPHGVLSLTIVLSPVSSKSIGKR